MRQHSGRRVIPGERCSFPSNVHRILAVLLAAVWFIPMAPAVADPNEVAPSYGFLELDDSRAVVDANGARLLTFVRFGADDRVLWMRGFVDIDAWCAFARNDPNLSAFKMEQAGWALSQANEAIFWPLQALMYICPDVRDTVGAIESRPAVFDRFTRKWRTPHIELTTGENLCHQPSGTVYWNPTITRAYGAPVAWDAFPPLVGLAHELVHAWQRVVEDRQMYGSSMQVEAMKRENLVRYAFYRKVPGHEWVRPRPGNKGYIRNGTFVAYFEDMEWSEWSADFNPMLDVFEEDR